MSLITLVRHSLRRARIERAEQDLAYSREYADSHLAAEARKLNEMRRAHDPRTSEEIALDISRRAKGVA